MRQEYQITVPRTIDLSCLLGLGGEPLGQVTQRDTYLAGEETWRIREQNGQYLFTQKGHDVGHLARVKDVVDERFINEREARQLIKKRGVRIEIFKTRTLCRLDDAVIAIDTVEHLGDFLEIRSGSEAALFKILRMLGISEREVTKESYLEMMLRKSLPDWFRFVLHLHDKVGELTFGIISGVMTTTGMLVGVNSATSSKLAVIAAILTVAIADSFSDAFGMFLSKMSERGTTRKTAIRYATGTMIGKFILPLTFVAPVLLLPLSTGVWLALAWGAFMLILLSFESALVRQEKMIVVIGRNLGLGMLIILFAMVAGSAISQFIG